MPKLLCLTDISDCTHALFFHQQADLKQLVHSLQESGTGGVTVCAAGHQFHQTIGLAVSLSRDQINVNTTCKLSEKRMDMQTCHWKSSSTIEFSSFVVLVVA